MRNLPHFFITVVFILTLAVQASLAAAEESPVQFNRDIRPILSDHCFACHGPDKNKREADLRLDTEPGLLGEGGGKGAVVPGQPEASELMRRIEAHDDTQMPPAEFGKKLSKEQIQLVRRWIEQGARWQGHWAFQKIARSEPPGEIQDGQKQNGLKQNASANAIDHFIRQSLHREKLDTSPAADRRTLARRLSFDLLGLPAKPELIAAFANDSSPDATERLVNQLLSSPHFGERMAMWWLDLVRYADSAGYHGDQPVSVSPYRDFVIASFNENKPFDRFTHEQLAGDLMDQPTQELQIAAGYNRLGMMSAEGGVQPKEYLAKYIAERVRNLGGTWLGLTLGCCECHDHKYDPLTARDFYQFEAFFADIEERGLYSGAKWGNEMQVPTTEQTVALRKLEEQIASAKLGLDATTDELLAAQQEWESSQIVWTPLKPVSAISEAGVTLTINDLAEILASGKNPDTDTYTLVFESLPTPVTAIRIDVLPHKSFPKNGPGRAGNGNFVLTEFEAIAVSSPAETTEASSEVAKSLAFQNASASYEQTGAAGDNPYKKWAVAAAIDGDAKGAKWGWAIMEQAGQPNAAVFEIKPESQSLLDANTKLKLVLKQNLDNPKHTLGHFRISVTSAPLPIGIQQLPPLEIQAILRTARDARTAEQTKQLAAHYRSIAPSLEPLRKELTKQEKQRQQLNDSITTTLVTKTVEPRMVRILNRGNWMDETGDVVQPAIPDWLGGIASSDKRRLTRLDLAHWVTSRDNPLTARVTVNRLWKLFFGTGLSRNLDDLGAQGDWPSHPELLDWLAGEFIDSGWNIKHMIKLMVMSDAYQQSSFVPPVAAELDPYNRWLSHQGRWRLDAEMVRDAALSISGMLVDSIGGTSVKPYQPAGYWAYLNFPQREWKNGTGDELYRRGLYTHWQRQYLHPSMAAFDAPSREECTATRSRSNTPLQALVLLNDPEYVEAARVFAQRILDAEPNDEGRVEWALREALGRSSRAGESELLLSLLTKHREATKADEAKPLLSVGESPLRKDADVIELAAWTSVARVILNLHGTITRN